MEAKKQIEKSFNRREKTCPVTELRSLSFIPSHSQGFTFQIWLSGPSMKRFPISSMARLILSAGARLKACSGC